MRGDIRQSVETAKDVIRACLAFRKHQVRAAVARFGQNLLRPDHRDTADTPRFAQSLDRPPQDRLLLEANQRLDLRACLLRELSCDSASGRQHDITYSVASA